MALENWRGIARLVRHKQTAQNRNEWSTVADAVTTHQQLLATRNLRLSWVAAPILANAYGDTVPARHFDPRRRAAPPLTSAGGPAGYE